MRHAYRLATLTGCQPFWLYSAPTKQLYLHPLILVLFALPAFCVSVRGYFFGGRVNAAPLLLSSFLLFVNVAVMVLAWWHYWEASHPGWSVVLRRVARVVQPQMDSLHHSQHHDFRGRFPARRDCLLACLPICEKEALCIITPRMGVTILEKATSPAVPFVARLGLSLHRIAINLLKSNNFA